MDYSSSTCPICNTDIQNTLLKKCSKCNWVFINENSLDQNTYSSLIDWAIISYERLQDLESRGNYTQLRVNDRLNRQGDTIIKLEKEIEKIRLHIKLESTETHQDITANTTVNNACTNHSNVEVAEKSSILSELLEDIDKSEDSSSAMMESTPIDTNLTTEERITSDYDLTLSTFANKYSVVPANLTKNSIDYNTNNEGILILEENNRGIYWILSVGDCVYLVPTDKYINQHSYSSTSMMFDDQSYTPNYTKIKILKPALAIELNTNPRTWQLQNKGKLLFL